MVTKLLLILRGTFVAAICALLVPGVTASAQTLPVRTISDGEFAIAQAAGAPTIASLTPSSGPLGTDVTIVGTNFTAENNVVQFSSAARSFDAGSPVGSGDGTHLEFRVTACPSYMPRCPMAYIPAGNYAVTVRNANGTSNSVIFAIVSP